jgi:hypothetical protein
MDGVFEPIEGIARTVLETPAAVKRKKSKERRMSLKKRGAHLAMVVKTASTKQNHVTPSTLRRTDSVGRKVRRYGFACDMAPFRRWPPVERYLGCRGGAHHNGRARIKERKICGRPLPQNVVDDAVGADAALRRSGTQIRRAGGR